MAFKMFDKIILKDGRTANIVEIYNNGEAYEADIDTEHGIITDTIYPSEILRSIE